MENGFGAPSAFLSGDLFPTLTRLSFDEIVAVLRFGGEVDGCGFRVEYALMSVIVLALARPHLLHLSASYTAFIPYIRGECGAGRKNRTSLFFPAPSFYYLCYTKIEAVRNKNI